MLRRCSGHPGWANYSEVTVCERWRLPDGVGFENFLLDLGPRPIDEPASKHAGKVIYQTLGRWRDQGNYEPNNCEWMTAERQARHRGPKSGTSSKFKGVFAKRRGRWGAHSVLAGNLGSFIVEEDAARAYDAAARATWGEDCYLNFPSG